MRSSFGAVSGVLERLRLPQIGFKQALWLTPMTLVVHNLEEFPRILDFEQRHLHGVTGMLPGYNQMAAAIVLTDILPFVIAANAARSGPHSWGVGIHLGLQAALFANAVTHLGQTLWFSDYSPGTATALLLFVPMTFYLYRQVLREGYVTRGEAISAAAVGAIALVPAILLLLGAGQMLTGE
jgi:hypothetical protein